MKKMITKTTLILFIMTVLSFIGHLFIYPRLPDIIPVQWGSDGSVNSYGGKYIDLIMAALPIVILLLLTYMPYIDPRKANYRKHRHAYSIMTIGITLLLIACSWLTGLAGLGYSINIQTLIPVGMGILFIVLGNAMPQIRSSYFFGIRTPWTLENPDVWRKTHKFGGILFCIIGVLFIISAFIGSSQFSNIILLPVVLGSVAMFYIYSFIVYKQLTK